MCVTVAAWKWRRRKQSKTASSFCFTFKEQVALHNKIVYVSVCECVQANLPSASLFTIQCMLASYNSLAIVAYICYITCAHTSTYSRAYSPRSDQILMNFIRCYFEIIVLLCARDNVRFEHFQLCCWCGCCCCFFFVLLSYFGRFATSKYYVCL